MILYYGYAKFVLIFKFVFLNILVNFSVCCLRMWIKLIWCCFYLRCLFCIWGGGGGGGGGGSYFLIYSYCCWLIYPFCWIPFVLLHLWKFAFYTSENKMFKELLVKTKQRYSWHLSCPKQSTVDMHISCCRRTDIKILPQNLSQEAILPVQWGVQHWNKSFDDTVHPNWRHNVGTCSVSSPDVHANDYSPLCNATDVSIIPFASNRISLLSPTVVRVISYFRPTPPLNGLSSYVLDSF